MYDKNNSDFDRFVTLYLAEQDKRNEELQEKEFQIRILRIVNTLLTIFLLTSLAALGWLYFGGSFNKSDSPKDGQYISMTLNEMSALRKNSVAKAKHEYEDNFYRITGNIKEINDDIKYITLLNPDDMKDITTFKFNVNDESVKDAIAAHNLGDRITLNCKCKSVGRFKGFEFDITEITDENADDYTIVPLNKLNEDKNTDLSAAKAEYSGKKIITEGKVSKIDKNHNYFTLYNYHDVTDKNTYKFYISEQLREQAIVLSPDQAIRVKGICTGVGLVNGYEFALEEIFADEQEYTDTDISRLSYQLSTDIDNAQGYKDRFLKFTGKFDSYNAKADYFVLKNPDNAYDKTEYIIYLNGSDNFRHIIEKYGKDKNITVYTRCRSVSRFKGYEFDLKDIVEEWANYS